MTGNNDSWTAGLTAPGNTIGRFIVLHPLGSGAMGIVVAAYDPELDRKLAIKVLRPNPFGEERTETEQRRLLREAQAMAALAHPNVVTVYDVGTVGDQVFIAMEYLDSETVTRWLKGGRTTAAVLRVFQAAGKGLAAAHRAGLVHRDFKPDNVLVARDGRVKVMDFGLARPLPVEDGSLTGERSSQDPMDPTRSPTSGRLLDASLTGEGMIAGTPSYMAPECLAGHPATPASDQFSFSVALYRALYGEHPFPRRSVLELIAQGCGPIQDPPPGNKVPSWLRNVLLRGLSERPEDRFPDMEALLDALSRDPAARKRRILSGAALTLAAAGILAGAVFLAQRPAIRCERAGDAIGSVWNPEVRQQLANAFAATGVPSADGAWQRVAKTLDTYASDWKAMRIEACRATHVRGEQSEELLDLRMACLDDRLEELITLIEQLRSPNRELIQHAPRAVLDLSSLAGCADTAALTAPIPPPHDPRIRGRVRALRKSLAEARGKRLLGNVEDTIATVREIVAQARDLGYQPLLAEALTLQGRMEEFSHQVDASRAHLLDGLTAALASHHDEAAIQALIGLTWLDGNDTFDFPRAHTWARLAEAILQRLPRSKELALELANALGSTNQAEGNVEAAIREHRSAIELAKKLYGPGSFFVARSMGNLGTAELTRGDFQTAATIFRKVLPTIQQDLGVSFDTAMAENNLAAALLELGDTAGARTHFEKAQELYSQTLGEKSVWVIITRLNLALVDLQDGEPARTLREIDALEPAFRAAFPAQHPFSAYLDYARGSALLDLGHIGRALPLLDRTVRIRSSSSSVMPYELAQAQFALARARWAAGQRAQALELARQAAAILDSLPQGPMPFRDRVKAWFASHGGHTR